MNTCETCKFWDVERMKDFQFSDDPKEAGVCVSLDKRLSICLPDDRSAPRGALVTTKDFGCIAHQPK